MKKSMSAACALLFVTALAFAQAGPAQVLDLKTLDRFLEDYPKIIADAQAAGISVEESAGPNGADPMAALADPSAGSLSQVLRASMDAMKQKPQVRELLTKHGWDDGFWDVLFVLASSLGVVSMEEGFEGRPLPEMMVPFVDDLRGAVHPNDLELVKKDRERIESVVTADGE